MLKKLRIILTLLDSGNPIGACRSRKGLHVHELTGKLKGVWAVKVTGNWRVTFRVDEYGNAYDVDLQDYH